MRRPLRIVSASGLARAGGGRAERGEVAGRARRAQARQHGRLLRLGRRGLAREPQRARRLPRREHQREHRAYRAERRARRGPDQREHFPAERIGGSHCSVQNTAVSHTPLPAAPGAARATSASIPAARDARALDDDRYTRDRDYDWTRPSGAARSAGSARFVVISILNK